MSDPVKAITGVLRQCCDPPATLRIERGESRAWQSLLFDGARHHIRLGLSGGRLDGALDRLRQALAVPDFVIPGHIVADIRLSAVDHEGEHAVLTLEALTIEA
ncbi:hypothetical protein [Rhizorhabdus dicambivorans]|uniref:Uncharacterized protein n=1 Tax=Rhizorhabdus dicambivorans TaxID=1850238 RepID=A0A2A4G249_9SPHN|nr:hypothetical protein [Rhizorhabdus dicambivorans]ATE64819.1 hypothetical protein CMV14_10760 [Rhizorhabdus dicambivorans]PCE44094.1 hypothetical protein COO09_00145 [Rhizorhabdus dicambivorans]